MAASPNDARNRVRRRSRRSARGRQVRREYGRRRTTSVPPRKAGSAAMLSAAFPCSCSRTSPPFLSQGAKRRDDHEEGVAPSTRAFARSGRTSSAANRGTGRRPLRDRRRVSTIAHMSRATDHRCDSCGYQISTSAPFPRCPMCGGDAWRLIAPTRQARILVPERRDAPAGKLLV